LRCTPALTFLATRRTLMAMRTLLGGLVLTLGLIGYSLTLLVRKRQVQQQARVLRLSQERFAGILNSADDAIISIDADSRILLFNRGAEKIFGYAAQAIIGQPLDVLLPERHQAEGRRQFAAFDAQPAAGRGVGERITMTGRRGSGEEFPAEASISKITIEGEEIFTAILRDMTEKRKLEAQFLQAQKMEAIGQLTGGVAHDFNNLLQVIIGYTALASREVGLEQTAQGHLAEVKIAAERAVALTRQLLAFSRRQVLQPKSINLNGLIENLAKMLRRMIGDDIDFVFRGGERLATIYADQVQIEQVLLNLAINARDAMPEGGQLLLITENVYLDAGFRVRHPWAREGPFVLISVSDTGHGMDETTQTRIFEPFFTTKDEGKGTGLGLATTYGIIKQHGGFIHVYSEVGKGTTFRLYLPITDKTPQWDAAEEAAVAARGGHETILVAEDSPAVRELVVRILGEAGYTTLAAANGEEALRIFVDQRDRIDLVLLDMIMPQMNGRAACEQMRRLKPGIPIIFSSGYTTGSVQTEFFERENLELVPKPYAPRQLLFKVRKVLDEKGSAERMPDDATAE
jgi:PAS domain S-box-containing protein